MTKLFKPENKRADIDNSAPILLNKTDLIKLGNKELLS
jgi:hypothetical protein